MVVALFVIVMYSKTAYAANDSFENALSISVNQDVADVFYAEEFVVYKYYEFTLPEAGFISMGVVPADSSISSIVLFDSDKKSINEIKGKDSLMSNNIGLPGGTYYVRVQTGYSQEEVNYVLKVNYTQSDSWETEVNNDFARADEIVIGKPITGSIMKGTIYADSDGFIDVDYYKFTLNQDAYVHIDFLHEEVQSTEEFSAVWQCQLYDQNGEETMYENINGWRTVKLTKGTYYYMVKGFKDSGPGIVYVMGEEAWTTPPRITPNIDYTVSITYTTPKVKISKLAAPTSKKLKVKWKKLEVASGYEVVTATDKKFKKNKRVTLVEGNKNHVTIKKLKNKKTYYVKVRGYILVDGQKYYGEYSKVKKIKVPTKRKAKSKGIFIVTESVQQHLL
jgi:hypothetical protein